jgi:raffinose/stachyose/melibiose transport system permease protein
MINLTASNKKFNIHSFISSLFLVISAFLFVLPIYISLVGVFKTDDNIIRYPLALPFPGTFANVKYVLTDPSGNILRMYLNTLIIVSIALIVTLLVSSMAAFYTSGGKTKASRFLYVYFIFGLMIPYQIAFLGVVQILKRVHLIGTFPGIILVFISGNIMFSVFMYHGFMKSIPSELQEAASIDGAGQLRLFWQIIFPLVKPCTATTAIFAGLGMWNDFFTPLIVLGGGKLATVTSGIYTSISLYSSAWGHVFAYVFFASLPIVVIYIFAQKSIVSGLTAGAIKG